MLGSRDSPPRVVCVGVYPFKQSLTLGLPLIT